MVRSFFTSIRTRGPRRHHRRGAVIVLAVFLMVVMLGFVALGLDIGYISVARTELQRTADSAAMASAWELLDEDRLRGPSYLATIHREARETAFDYALQNKVCGLSPEVDLNDSNDAAGDIVLGRYSDGALSTSGSAAGYNAVRVRVVRQNGRNGEVPLFFARIFGMDSVASEAQATAMFRDGVSGFRTTRSNPFTSLLPFALDINEWNRMMAGGGVDEWDYDPTTRDVERGTDGVREIKLFPAKSSGSGGITPGNFGTIDFGASGNSTSELGRQISQGVSAEDLAYHGGEVKLDPVTNSLELNGETGMSVGMEHALPDVLGKSRTIPLYSKVAGGGNTAQFTIVAFVGVRIVDYDLNGNNKYIMIQPAVVVDETAISTDSPTSYAVFQPVLLVQ